MSEGRRFVFKRDNKNVPTMSEGKRHFLLRTWQGQQEPRGGLLRGGAGTERFFFVFRAFKAVKRWIFARKYGIMWLQKPLKFTDAHPKPTDWDVA